MPNLDLLDVSHNRLTLLAADVGQMQRLERLNLSHNALEDLPPSVGAMPRLLELDVQHNKLKVLPPALGRASGHLRRLHFAEGNALSPEFVALSKATTATLMRELQVMDGRFPSSDEVVTHAAMQARCSPTHIATWKEEYYGLFSNMPGTAQLDAAASTHPGPSAKLSRLSPDVWVESCRQMETPVPVKLAERIYEAMHWTTGPGQVSIITIYGRITLDSPPLGRSRLLPYMDV